MESKYTSNEYVDYGPLQSIYPGVEKFNQGVNFGINYPLFRKMYLRMKYFHYFGDVHSRYYNVNVSAKASGFSGLISCPISFDFN